MNVPIEKLIPALKELMGKAHDHMKSEFAGIRTGKASPALVENIMVDYYGTQTRLKDLANITAPEPRMLVVQPYDASQMHAVEKAINMSNIGVHPVNDGKILRLPIPELSEERRAALAKQVHGLAEEARVAIRNVRRDGNEAVKKALKDKAISENERDTLLKKIQELTDESIKKVDESMKAKEKDIMSI